MSSPASSPASPHASPPGHHERLWAPWYAWLLAAGFVAAVAWVFVVPLEVFRDDGVPVGFVLGTVALALLVGGALLRYSSVVVAADDRGFRAGRALLPWSACGPASSLTGDEVRRAAGPDANANDYLLLRGYCGGAVRVVVRDEHDVTPHWLVSTRHPRELAEAVNARRMQD